MLRRTQLGYISQENWKTLRLRYVNDQGELQEETLSLSGEPIIFLNPTCFRPFKQSFEYSFLSDGTLICAGDLCVLGHLDAVGGVISISLYGYSVAGPTRRIVDLIELPDGFVAVVWQVRAINLVSIIHLASGKVYSEKHARLQLG
jgi:hypothetical protein